MRNLQQCHDELKELRPQVCIVNASTILQEEGNETGNGSNEGGTDEKGVGAGCCDCAGCALGGDAGAVRHSRWHSRDHGGGSLDLSIAYLGDRSASRSLDLSVADLSDWGAGRSLNLSVADLGDGGGGRSLDLSVADLGDWGARGSRSLNLSVANLRDWHARKGGWGLDLSVTDLGDDASGNLNLSVRDLSEDDGGWFLGLSVGDLRDDGSGSSWLSIRALSDLTSRAGAARDNVDEDRLAVWGNRLAVEVVEVASQALPEDSR